MAFEVPVIGSPNTSQDPKIKSAIEGTNTFIATYRTLLFARTNLTTDAAAATYQIGNASNRTSGLEIGATESLPYFYFDDADYVVTGQTQKLRVRAQVAANATKPTIKFTIGLYPLTVAGAADTMVPTLGTVVSGSTVEINEPAASTVTSAVGSDFTIPSDGAYMLGVVTSGTLTNNSRVNISAQLQTRST